jgi:hypothetical protein
MTLTDREARWLARIRKYQRWWPYTRWFCLGSSVGLGILYVSLLYRLVSLADDRSVDSATLIAMLAPICWIMLFFSVWPLGFALGHWSGDIRTRLLFRLIDEHEGKGAEPDAAPNSRPSSPLATSQEPQTPDSLRTSSSGGCG